MPTAVEELTVDELAARTGMTVRTVRFYAAEGLLPAPERRGRVAYYGVQHRMRLELIRELQDHGYTLAAIERVLDRIPLDASAAEFAMQAALLAPWTPERTEELDRDGLERRAGRRLGRQSWTCFSRSASSSGPARADSAPRPRPSAWAFRCSTCRCRPPCCATRLR